MGDQVKLKPAYPERSATPPVLLRRRLRARYYAASAEYRLATHWLHFDGSDPDAWTAFGLARLNLDMARQEYFACALEN